MSGQDEFEEESVRKSYGKPYTSKHPVPTVKGYREHRAEIKKREEEGGVVEEDQENEGPSKPKRAYDSVKAIAKGEDQQQEQQSYATANRNFANRPKKQDNNSGQRHEDDHGQDQESHGDDGDQRSGQWQESTCTSADKGDENAKNKSATETAASHVDPKQKRKDMKKIKRHGGGREVTDPVTHLPVVIHDMTDQNLDAAPENEPAAGSDHRTLTGLPGASKSRDDLRQEQTELDRGTRGMRKLFPPPAFQDTRRDMIKAYRMALVAGLGSIGVISLLTLLVITLLQGRSFLPDDSNTTWLGSKHLAAWKWFSIPLTLLIATGAVAALSAGVSGWLSRKVEEIFDDKTWDAAREEEEETNDSEYELPESVAWLNSLFASIWPLINPDLFASLVDTLEDVMQASLPKVIRMVSVDDMGQGTEGIRILGVRWLPTGAAGQSVDQHGNLEPAKENDRAAPGEGQIEDGEKDERNKKEPNEMKDDDKESQGAKQREEEQQAVREGMEAEDGDFFNLELAFAYRARSSGKAIKSKVKNAHLYLKFYLPGGIAVPVWVELKGIIGTMRLRLQLAPDPPFFSLCTLTFLGQPRANLSCVPLSKHSLNLMNVPLISSFVQSAIDAALAEYVAPKSLTLDLKAMLVGDDFKKDTSTRGVIMVYIKKAEEFKNGDSGIGPFKGSSDAYVTVSWGKFGKPVGSTRVIVDEQNPIWNEWVSVLVSPEELNADETLRLQLWDSDKHTADDDLGRVELNLKELMHGSKTKNKMSSREDEFRADDPDEKMPGKLTWSVGYYEKAHIQQRQLDQQTVDDKIRSKAALKKRASETAANKLREAAGAKDESSELHQQTLQDYKEKEDEMIMSAPPLDDLPSGVLSIQIHNITGLEVAKLNRLDRKQGDDQESEGEAECEEDLPDSYCSVILNHRRVYRTRTKPRNAKPFFNASTERFIRDWRTAEVVIAVRDSREREDDPLLGIVYLPLRRVFEKRSQVMETYPLAGGIGYGRARISLVWRSVELHMPKELMGWDYGTLEVKGPIKMKHGSFSNDTLNSCKIKLKSKLGSTKMYPASSEKNEGTDGWRPKTKRGDNDCSVFLPLKKRYASPLFIEWKKSRLGADAIPAFAVFWLSDVPDEEEKTVSLKVWRGGKAQIKRARNCCDYNGLEDNEQALGEIEVTMKLWSGLSGYHKTYANKSGNGDVKAVMEVLDTVNDEKMGDDSDDDGSGSDNSSSDSDSEYDKLDDNEGNKNTRQEREKRKMLRKAGGDSSSDEDEKGGGGNSSKNPITMIKKQATSLLEGHDNDGNGKDDDSGGIRAQIQDYKQHHRSLHRKHRGVMQWKGARTLDWMAGKAKRGTSKVGQLFEHSEKEPGVETEV